VRVNQCDKKPFYGSKKTMLAILVILGSANCRAKTDKGFSHYLNFFQIRYYLNEDLKDPLPKGLAKFTVGDAYDDLPQFIYVSFSDTYGHVEVTPVKAKEYAVALTDPEISRLFEHSNRIPKSLVQKADIEKIHQELIRTKLELFKYGTELTYGVKLDSKDFPILSSDGKAIPDANLAYYQQGKTIVIPPTYSRKFNTRFFFNMNNPAVREYVIRYALKKLSYCKDNALYIDNILIGDQLFESGNELHYISEGRSAQQAEVYARQIVYILKEIKKRSGASVLINGFRDNHTQIGILYDEITSPNNIDCIDGIMIEGRFWYDKTYAPWCTNVEFYLDTIRKAKKLNKKILLTASSPQTNQYHSELIFNIWLWLHLVADTNVYVYINDTYIHPMKNLYVYDFPLGQPLEPPRKEGNIWIRKYERGTILFDTTSGKLNGIGFKAQQAPSKTVK